MRKENRAHESSDKESVDVSKSTKIGIHSVRNLLGSRKQLDLFSDHDTRFSKEHGVPLQGKIERFGVDLSDFQMRVVEGILRGFSETNYKGNLTPLDSNSLIEEKFSGKTPNAYKYIDEVPRIKVTQAQLLEWSGINRGSMASVRRALMALEDLGVQQYCFYYDRIALDDNRNPIKSKNGWKMEEVNVVDTLFTIKTIRTEKTGRVQYYEITPSSVFLDQRESYFMLIPYNWRQEVRQLYGNKKTSSYLFRFLLFLRYQYEIKRRSKNEAPPYCIQLSSEEICIALKMPKSVYTRNPKRANQILDDAYSVAQSLGYLLDFERMDYCDKLMLNESKFYTPKSLSHTDSPSSKLLKAFYENKRKLDPATALPSGADFAKEAHEFEKILSERSFDEVKKAIEWAFKKRFWCARVSTPMKLRKTCSELVMEMRADQLGSKANRAEANRKLSERVSEQSDLFIPEKEGLVIHSGGQGKPELLRYDNDRFEDMLKRVLKKRGMSISELS